MRPSDRHLHWSCTQKPLFVHKDSARLQRRRQDVASLLGGDMFCRTRDIPLHVHERKQGPSSLMPLDFSSDYYHPENPVAQRFAKQLTGEFERYMIARHGHGKGTLTLATTGDFPLREDQLRPNDPNPSQSLQMGHIFPVAESMITTNGEVDMGQMLGIAENPPISEEVQLDTEVALLLATMYPTSATRRTVVHILRGER